ncbi:FAD/NAD P-binding domain-containing protein [Gloeophyllum trabeum ATCC 11539]|uniref:FAD/NAD P-binding domain-containing protein n=1 Tax=Gloeophyllum trabeum (strain ATCC 11539 / FP-39264 / Madison 617) TaxID=670483 RepID=S7QGJ9_GLOTA|nr:FAD/NAD P-binding domain-containing protein [Gloeophyllum trabeum ATCC 11539]EPQ58318.1 FAD/NAD P-binding domain-containing protein [Gloeophyllum trabeum ATCC 11539]
MARRIAGISTAIALQERLRYASFTIYERAGDVGGTWRDNTYPGCGSDVPGHAYSLSTELNPSWSSYLVSQPEIRAYWEALFHKHNLGRKTLFNHDITTLQWDQGEQLWRLTAVDRFNNTEKEVEAHIVVSAIGGFMYPLFPDIPGQESFKGLTWHSARWRHDIDLKGKRVGVIGNGCSAAQLIPKVSEDPTVEVINFCRTQQWYSPRIQYTYPPWARWIFSHTPLATRLYRIWLMVKVSLLSVLVATVYLILWFQVFSSYMKKTAPEEYHKYLIPSFPPGCKRIIIDPGFLESLHRPNVSMVWDGIERIEESGIKLRTGEQVSLDVIVFATGYGLNPKLPMSGKNKLNLQDFFASQGGPTSYMGTCAPGFPNLYTLLGPNVATGHSSVIFSEEVQIQWVLQLIKPVIDGAVKSLEVSQEAFHEYNAWLQERLKNSVWTECHSYYRSDRREGKVVANFPGPMSLFWWILRKPRWNHFVLVGGESWIRQQSRARRIRLLGIFVGFLALVCTGLASSDSIRQGLKFWMQQVSVSSIVGCTCIDSFDSKVFDMEGWK